MTYGGPELPDPDGIVPPSEIDYDFYRRKAVAERRTAMRAFWSWLFAALSRRRSRCLDSATVSCDFAAMDIKICGLKTEDALAAALAGGASHIGFIFFPKSPRYISPEDAGRLRKGACGRAKAVAVTVDADDAFLERIVSEMQPDMLQLHGKETPERAAELKLRYGLPVMKVLAVSNAADLAKTEPFVGIADRFLFDAKPPAGSELPGGNGVSFDWSLLTEFDRSVDYFLSGGLSAANVGEALRLANPPGLDISSGVESAPGVKDPARIEAFLRAVRAAQSKSAA